MSSRPPEYREDAPAALALQRERRLQACRARFRERAYDPQKTPWTQAEVRELLWLDGLAAVGHVGAQRVRRDALSELKRMDELVLLAPGFVESLAPLNRTAAFALVRHECRKAAPAADALQRWLLYIGEAGAALAEATREIAAIRGALAAGDGERLSQAAKHAYYELDEGRARTKNDFVVARLLFQCAQAGGPATRRLCERAAELGSPEVRLEFSLADSADPKLTLAASRDPWSVELAAAIAEARAIGPLGDADRDYFRRANWSLVKPELDEPQRSVMLGELAARRLRAGDPQGADRLRLRAAELGSLAAILACLDQDAERICAWLANGGERSKGAAKAVGELCAATGGLTPARLASHLETVRGWMQRNPRFGRIGMALCVNAGAAFELGKDALDGGLERALEWYALALRTRARDPKTGELTDVFCWELAAAFDARERTHLFDEPGLAVAWYDRALRRGGQLSLQRLLEAGAAGELGLARDAGAALERVQAFLAAPSARLHHGHAAETVTKLRHCAATLDPAHAAIWNHVADKLVRPEELKAAAQGIPWQELETKIDLALAYREMGDEDGAQILLAEVLGAGTEDQQARARKLQAEKGTEQITRRQP